MAADSGGRLWAELPSAASQRLRVLSASWLSQEFCRERTNTAALKALKLRRLDQPEPSQENAYVQTPSEHPAKRFLPLRRNLIWQERCASMSQSAAAVVGRRFNKLADKQFPSLKIGTDTHSFEGFFPGTVKEITMELIFERFRSDSCMREVSIVPFVKNSQLMRLAPSISTSSAKRGLTSGSPMPLKIMEKGLAGRLLRIKFKSSGIKFGHCLLHANVNRQDSLNCICLWLPPELCEVTCSNIGTYT